MVFLDVFLSWRIISSNGRNARSAEQRHDIRCATYLATRRPPNLDVRSNDVRSTRAPIYAARDGRSTRPPICVIRTAFTY